MARIFTGWHATGIIVGFFGVVIAVNFTMATLASRTFGGTVVDNSYVASQKFNVWLAEARAQKSLGWTATVDLNPARHVRVDGRVPRGAIVTAVAVHPLGRIPDQSLTFAATGDAYLSRTALPPGRFTVRVRVTSNGRSADFVGGVPA